MLTLIMTILSKAGGLFKLSSLSKLTQGNNKYVTCAVGGLSLLVLGFALGRFTNKPKVVEKTVTQEKIVYQDRIVEHKVYVISETKKEHKVTEIVKKPDGSTTTIITQDTNTDKDTKADTNKTQTEQKNETLLVTKEKTTDAYPNWRIGAGAGVSVPLLLGQAPEIGIPGMKGSYLELELDRRLGGPVWLGIRGSTLGNVGLNLSVTF